MALSNIRVVCSLLTGSIMIARFGKKPNIALEHRPAEEEVLRALTKHMMEDAPKGSEKVFTLGEEKYRLTLVPILEGAGQSK